MVFETSSFLCLVVDVISEVSLSDPEIDDFDGAQAHPKQRPPAEPWDDQMHGRVETLRGTMTFLPEERAGRGCFRSEGAMLTVRTSMRVSS